MELKGINEDMEIMINTLGCKSLKELLEKQVDSIDTCIDVLNNQKNISCLRDKFGTTSMCCSYLPGTNGVIYAMDAIGFHADSINRRNVKTTYLSKSKPKRTFHPEDTLKIDIPVNVYFSYIRIALQKLLDTHLRYMYKKTGNGFNTDIVNEVYNYLVLSSAIQVELPGSDKDSGNSPRAILSRVIKNSKLETSPVDTTI